MYLIINKWVTAVKVLNFSGHYLRNRSTLDIGVLGYICIVWPNEHSPEVSHIPPVTPCIEEARCLKVKTNSRSGQKQPKTLFVYTCRLAIAAVLCVSGGGGYLINTGLCNRSYVSEIMVVIYFYYCHCSYFNCYYCFKNKRNSRIVLTDEWFQIVKSNLFCH